MTLVKKALRNLVLVGMLAAAGLYLQGCCFDWGDCGGGGHYHGGGGHCH